MKYLSAGLLLSVALATSAFADNIPTRGPDAAPEYKEAINKLNADVTAWNARCVVTNSDAEQKWCEEQRASLETRKIALRNGVIPNSSTPNVSAFPTVDVILRYATGGKVLKRVQTDSTGHFTLGTFPGGTYILEFRAAKGSGVKDQRFAIQVDGIKAKGRQNGILAKYLLGGFGVDVETVAGAALQGQVTTGSLAQAKKMIWMPKEIGSNIPGRWVEEGSGRNVAGVNAGIIRRDTIVKMQDHNDY
jgi:hypothetical protein